MAFAGVISDLFGCARARRTREISDDASSANDTAGGDVPAGDAQTVKTRPVDALGGAHATSGRDNDLSPGTFPGGGFQLSDTKGSNEASNDRDHVRVSLNQDKTRPNPGWKIQKQLLVTTNNEVPSIQPASAAEEKLQQPVKGREEAVSTAAPVAVEIEEMPAITSRSESIVSPGAHATNIANEAIAAPAKEVPDASAIVEACETSPSSSCKSLRVAPEQSQSSDLTATIALEPRGEPTIPNTPHMPEVVETLVVDTVSATEAPLDTTPVLESLNVAKADRESLKAAPLRLLDLSPEIRNLIYEYMVEERPIRMCRHDDAALVLRDGETAPARQRQYYNLTQVCRQIRQEYLPIYARKTRYIIDLWTQRGNLAKLDKVNGHVSIDIDAACFDMEPIDLLPLLRDLSRTRRTDRHFASLEGVIFKSISSIVGELNKLLPGTEECSQSWLETVNGPIKRIDLHLFPHDDIRQYYRFHGGEPLLRIVYPSSVTEDWMKRSFKSDEYEAYLDRIGLTSFEMHVVVGHASRRTTNAGRLPLNWRLSYAEPRLSLDRAHRRSQIMSQ
ncbi:hypothetical protein FB567DRAFT_599329 [Paraphoma chrysanthemicola]|uniref:Uncharacterized protein n=1 Tax=Paraphoma chrysanthemicola TaxID=798071 RepID=A0A8K0QRX9_9PLEO|nr:hypothetical protein FB567DRAFT_599329 [Paraphoma chrysanthemicola]